MEKGTRPERIWEIDFLRGVSIILMVGYHLLYDLGDYRGVKKFLGFSTDLSTTAWTIAQIFFAVLFVLLSGVSSTLTRSNLRRGLRLLVVSLVVSAVTYVFDPALAVFFGILQCLAFSMLIYGAVMEKWGAVALAAAGAVLIGLHWLIPLLMRGVAVNFDWLLPFGIHSPTYASFDYFPLIPWFGVFLIGSALGKSVYAPRRSLVPWRLPVTFVGIAGRHSLLIYIAHQPVIMGILYLLGSRPG